MPSSDPDATPITQEGPAAALFSARIEPDGLLFKASASMPLLRAAELAGVPRLPSSCRNGTCRTCICLLIEGRVVYRIEWPGVSMEEKKEGFILPCVAYPVSDVVLQLPF